MLYLLFVYAPSKPQHSQDLEWTIGPVRTFMARVDLKEEQEAHALAS